MLMHPLPSWRSSSLVVFVLIAALLFAQSSAPAFPDPGKPRSMSAAEQHQLGLQAAAQVYQQMPVLPDNSPESEYIRRLGKKLVATIPAQYSWPFEFHVIAQKDINAFALPGGPMFVNLGTITAAGNESELAGVMAHEIAHVYMQHSAKQADKSQWTGLLAGIASIAAGSMLGGMASQAAQMGIAMTAQGVSLKYSRSDESQADSVGAVILYKAGYNPQALADFFKTLQSQGGQAPPQILSDHPNPGNRTEAIEKEIRNWPPRNYMPDSADFQKTRQHALTVKAYTAEEIAAGAKSGQWAALNQKNGAVFKPVSGSVSLPVAQFVPLQSVLPTQKMVSADLGRMKIDRPDNWLVKLPQKQGDMVTIAPAKGVTQGHVGYGVLINGISPPRGERISIDELTSRLVQQMQQSDGVKPLGPPKPITVGGIEGRYVVMQSASPFPDSRGQQQIERDILVTVPQSDGSLVFMIFVAPESEFARFNPTYENMLKSVRF